MTSLLDLLNDPEPRPERESFARATDPSPSRAAADKGDSFGPATERVLRALVNVEAHNRHRVGATAAEVLMRMAYDADLAPDRNGVSRRLTSLMRRGYVRDTGERRDGGRGVEVTVYAATPEGRAWLA